MSKHPVMRMLLVALLRLQVSFPNRRVTLQAMADTLTAPVTDI